MRSTAAAGATRRGIDVVVIDDEDSIREGSRQALEIEGCQAAVASDGVSGLRLVEEAKPRVVLVDLRMPGLSGMEILAKLPEIDPRIVPIVITGYGTIDSAVEAMKLGAFDFLTKPFDMDQLLVSVRRGLDRHAATDVAPAAPTAFGPVPAVVPARPDPADQVLKGLEALADYQASGAAGSSFARELSELQREAHYHARKLGQLEQEGKALSEMAADLRLVDRVIEGHGFKKSALIQVLLGVQSAKRWLPRHVLAWVARRLDVPLSRVYEIASFYEAFSLVPQGKHTVQVCTGTACHVRQAPELSATVSELLGIKPGETDPRLDYTLKEVHCLGCCALAPVIKIDDAYHGDPSFRELKKLLSTDDEER